MPLPNRDSLNVVEIEQQDEVGKELKGIKKEVKKLNKNTRATLIPLWEFRTKEGEAFFWWIVDSNYLS